MLPMRDAHMSTENDRTQLMDLLDTMTKPYEFVGKLPDQNLVLNLISRQIPTLTGMLEVMDGTGIAMTRLLKVSGRTAKTIRTAGNILGFFGFIFELFNFIRIPLLYLVAKLMGEKIPFSLSNNAKWLYAGALLALSISGFIFASVGFILGITVASLVLAVSIFTAGKALYSRYKNNLKLTEINSQIGEEKNKLDKLIGKLNQIKQQVHDASAEEISDYAAEIDTLSKQYFSQVDVIQALYDTREIYIKIKKRKNNLYVLDKSAGVALSAIAVIGLAIVFTAPVTGLWVMVGSMILATLYVGVRVTAIIGPVIFKTILNKLTSFFVANEIAPEPLPTNRPSSLPPQDTSTQHTLASLVGEERMRETLVHTTSHQSYLIDLTNKINRVVIANDDAELLKTFLNSVTYLSVHSHPLTVDDITNFFEGLEDNQNVKRLLVSALIKAQDDLTITPPQFTSAVRESFSKLGIIVPARLSSLESSAHDSEQECGDTAFVNHS